MSLVIHSPPVALAGSASAQPRPIVRPHEADLHHGSRLRIGADTAAALGAALIVAAVLFNALLAFVNGHIITMNSQAVAVVQGGIVGLAVAIALLARPEGAAKWVMLGWATLMLWLLLTIARGYLDLKIAGEIVLAPAFVVLGLCGSTRALVRALLIIQCLLVIFAAWELFFPTSFGEALAIQNYYINTRGFSSEAFWAGSDNLFLSSQRPTGRLIDVGLDINRAGSLFLEPVSLGNWTVIVCAALAALWQDLSRRVRWMLIVTNILLLIACDGRLAMGFCFLLPISLVIFMKLRPSVRWWLPIAYLPAMTLALVLALQSGLLDPNGSYDDLPGRFSNSIQYLMALDLPSVLALKPVSGTVAADSGWVHVVVTQSIFGLVALWVSVSVLPAGGARTTRLTHCLALYVAVALPISYSILSIKSAAAMWFLVGLCCALDRRRSEAVVPGDGVAQ